MNKFTLKTAEIASKLRSALINEIDELNEIDEEDKSRIAVNVVGNILITLIAGCIVKDEDTKKSIINFYKSLQEETFAHYERLLKMAENE